MDREAGAPSRPAIVAPSQGVHVVVDRRFLPGTHALLVPKTADGRVLFAVPWLGKTILGTTDTPRGDLAREPTPFADEVAFILRESARYLRTAPQRSDVRSVWVGLRPLVKPSGEEGDNTKTLSREHTVLVGRSGLVTVTGGKWTTYRNMAEDCVTQAALLADLPDRPCPTKDLNLHGFRADADGPLAVYGTDARLIRELAAQRPELAEPLDAELDSIGAQVVFAVRCEMARTVEDVLARRTRALLLNADAAVRMAPRVAELMAAELGRDAAWTEAQIGEFEALADGYLVR
jgi:glycerol-3-phosphate dehydrogenase